MVSDQVAVITDIHGNLPALQAALARIDELGIARVYCGGDLVGYGPHPNEVCAVIQERAIPTIYGNYDYAIARDLDDCGCAYGTPHERALGQQSVDWTLEHTDRPAKDFMRELPFDLGFDLGERDVHLVHGSPRKVNEYLFEDKPASLYERLAAAEDADALVFGHTHKPWMHEFGGVLFVNCGSVGKPKDGDPRGAFALLDLDAAGVHARSSASPTTPTRWPARSPPPACRPNTPTSSSPPPECTWWSSAAATRGSPPPFAPASSIRAARSASSSPTRIPTTRSAGSPTCSRRRPARGPARARHPPTSSRRA